MPSARLPTSGTGTGTRPRGMRPARARVAHSGEGMNSDRMLRAAALDSSTVRGKSYCHTYELNHSNVAFRADSLEQHYTAAQATGVQLLRVGAWMQATNPAPEVFDWTYLDRVAALARIVPTVLVLYHYDWPTWLSASEVQAGVVAPAFMLRAAQQVAQRYAGVFHSYVPMCETSFQAHMIDCGRWFPNAGGGHTHPAHAWDLIAHALKSTALGLEWGDSTCRVGTSEPFVPDSFDHDARPFDVLAAAGLLHIVGVNNYRYPDLTASREEAARRWPGRPVWLAESGAIWQRPDEPREPAAWYDQAERAGYEAMFWCPALPMLCFDYGQLVGQHLF